MKPANRPFVRRVRLQARHQLKQSKGAWKEYKRSRGNWRRSPHLKTLPVYYLLLIAAVRLMSGATPEVIALATALYATGSVLGRGQTLVTLLRRAEPNYFFLHHPIPDDNVFKDHVVHVFRMSTWLLVVFAIALALVFREQSLTATAWWLIAPAAIAMWLACLGGILAVARFAGAATPLGGLAFLLYASAFATALLPVGAMSSLHHLLVFSPAGSITYFVAQYKLHQTWMLVSLVPALAYVAALPWLLRDLRRSYSSAPQAEQLFGGDETEHVGTAEYEAAPPVREIPDSDAAVRFAEAAVVRRVEERRWLNRVIDRWFSSRERVVYRFLCADVSRDWLRPWERGHQIAMLTLILAIPLAIPPWMVWVPGAVAVMVGLPLFGGSWAGFGDIASSSKVSPLYAGFPITFRELTTVLLKVNLVRILAWIPGAVVVSLAVGRTLSHPPGASLIAAFEFLYGLAVLQPIAIVFKCSAGSDDSRRWGWKRTPVVLATWLFIFAFAVSWLGLFFTSGAMKAVSAGAMPIAALLALVGYRFGYENGYWDLVKV